MKQEDIDKKIGMPDVDAEWAKFEREVINPKTAPRKPLYWGIGIAASIALVAGVFLFGYNTEEPRQIIAQQTAPMQQISSAEEKAIEKPVESTTSPEKDVPVIVETPEKNVSTIVNANQSPSSKLLAEATTPSTKTNVYDCEEVEPQFPGGDRALMEFVKKNQKYPDLAMEYGARGRVIMSCKVDDLGYVSDIKVSACKLTYDTQRMSRETEDRQVALKEQINKLMGEEGTRILNLMPQKWTPGRLFGKNVSMKYNIPITFSATEAERQTYLAQRKATNEDMQGHIAGLNIPDSVRQARRDSFLTQREIRMDSMLIVVNGTPIPLYKFKPNGVAPYLYKQHQLLSDSDLNVEERISRGVYIPYGASEEERKRRCFETYGDRAKYGVVEISTVPDKYCDEYINKHPELKKERHHIEGYVYDEDDNKPLADTWVHIQHKGIGAVTDSKGYFSIWLPQTNDTLQAFHIGYRRVRFVQPADTITIRMRSAMKLRDVKVLPKKEFEKYKGIE